MRAVGVSLSNSPALDLSKGDSDCDDGEGPANRQEQDEIPAPVRRPDRRGLRQTAHGAAALAPCEAERDERWPECKDERDSGRHGTRRKCGARREHETESDEPGGAYGRGQRSLSSVSSAAPTRSVRPNGLGIGDSHRGRLRNGVGTSDDQQQTRSRGLATASGSTRDGLQGLPGIASIAESKEPDERPMRPPDSTRVRAG